VSTLTRAATGVVLWPADHFASNNRLVRRGWSAALTPRSAMGPGVADADTKAAAARWCGHSHKPTEAAKACGSKMWRALPAEEA
jgi:hypothetical protein